MARVTKDPQIRIAEILDTAETLFHTQGYHETAISDIVKSIGVAQGTFYYYFKSKEEVLEAVISRFVSRIIAEIEAATERDNVIAPQKIERVFAKLFNSLKREDGLIFDYLFTDKYLHILDKIARQGKSLLAPVLIKIVEEGNREGYFNVSHPQECVDFINAIFDCLIEALYKRESQEKIAYRVQIAEVLIEKALGMQMGTIRMKI